MKKNSTLQQLSNLGLAKEDQENCTNSGATFSLRNVIIETPQFTEAVREIARRHHRGVEANVAEGMLLVAQTGSGKTTVLEYYASKFPPVRSPVGMKIPVVRVKTPSAPSVKMLAETILVAIGDPAAASGNTTVKTNRIIHLFKSCGVELLMIDEFQHFIDGNRMTECQKVTDWVKTLIDSLGIPVILSGLPRSILVLNSNPQMRRRFGAPLYMAPFSFHDKESQIEFRGVLNELQSSLPIECPDLSEANMARRFYFATHGLMDYIVKILDDAVSRCGAEGKVRIELADFARSFRRTIWMSAPEELNPFSGMTKFRLLNKPHEPFDVWDNIDQYLGEVKPSRSRHFPSGGSK